MRMKVCRFFLFFVHFSMFLFEIFVYLQRLMS